MSKKDSPVNSPADMLAFELLNAKVAPDTGDGSGPSIEQDVVGWSGKITLASSSPVTGATQITVSADFHGRAFAFEIYGGSFKKIGHLPKLSIDPDFDKNFSVHVDPAQAALFKNLLLNDFCLIRRYLNVIKDVDLQFSVAEKSSQLQFFDRNAQLLDDEVGRYTYIFTLIRAWLDVMTSFSSTAA